MGFSYGFNRAERIEHYRSGRDLVIMLADLVSRGGNLLLDIGPAADGTIPGVMEDRLLQIGAWLKVNGDAIYGTKPWKATRQWSAGEVPKVDYNKEYMSDYDVTRLTEKPAQGKAAIEAFFTAKGSDLFAILPRWPGRRFVVRDVGAGPVKTVRLLGSDGAGAVQRAGRVGVGRAAGLAGRIDESARLGSEGEPNAGEITHFPGTKPCAALLPGLCRGRRPGADPKAASSRRTSTAGCRYSQRDDGVDAAGAPGREPRCGKGDGREQERDADKYRAVPCSDAVQEA